MPKYKFSTTIQRTSYERLRAIAAVRRLEQGTLLDMAIAAQFDELPADKKAAAEAILRCTRD
jgi:hypothetical protein